MVIIGIIIIIIAIWLFFKLMKGSLKLIWKLLINALCGVIGLFLLNFFGGFIGLTLDITWFNAIVTGLLGLPGIILLLIIKYI